MFLENIREGIIKNKFLFELYINKREYERKTTIEHHGTRRLPKWCIIVLISFAILPYSLWQCPMQAENEYLGLKVKRRKIEKHQKSAELSFLSTVSNLGSKFSYV